MSVKTYKTLVRDTLAGLGPAGTDLEVSFGDSFTANEFHSEVIRALKVHTIEESGPIISSGSFAVVAGTFGTWQILETGASPRVDVLYLDPANATLKLLVGPGGTSTGIIPVGARVMYQFAVAANTTTAAGVTGTDYTNVPFPPSGNAAGLPFSPTGSLSSTNVAGALVELDAEKQPVDATLTALANLDSSTGFLKQTGADTFVKAQIAIADLPIGGNNNLSPDAANRMTGGEYARIAPLSDAGFNIRVLARDPNVAGRVWFLGAKFSQIGYSDDHGVTFTPKSVNPDTSKGVQSLLFVNGFAYLTISGTASLSGQVWRSAAPNASGAGWAWTKIFDLGAPPSGITPGANGTFRNSCLAVLAGSPNQLYLVDYGAGTITGGPQLYYSSDNGASWVSRKQWANAKHAHAIKIINGVPWVMLGDSGNNLADVGLWKASTAAATLWAQVTGYGADYSNIVGINFFTITPAGAIAPFIIAESDGPFNHGPLVYPGTSGAIRPMFPISSLPLQYAGTMRSLVITSEGNIMWVHTGEAGGIGPMDSFWVAAPPFNQPILLEAIDNTGSPLGTLGDGVEDGAYVWFGKTRITKPTLI
jgi:hypothetical protein